MKHIKYTVEEYLGSWRECRWCSDMVRADMWVRDEYNQPICIECNDERKHWPDFTFKYDDRTLSEDDIITETAYGTLKIERKKNHDK